MPLDWDNGTLSGYLLNLTLLHLWLGTITKITRDFSPGGQAGGFFYILLKEFYHKIYKLISSNFFTMKTRLSTPLHNTVATTKATQPPQPHYTTPSLDLAAGLKQAWPPPTNPYRSLTHSTSPPRGDLTSLMLLSVTGVVTVHPLHRRRTKARRNEAQICVMTWIWN